MSLGLITATSWAPGRPSELLGQGCGGTLCGQDEDKANVLLFVFDDAEE